MNYISSNTILNDIITRGSLSGDIDEDTIKIFINEAINDIITADNYINFITAKNINNSKVILPDNFRLPLLVIVKKISNCNLYLKDLSKNTNKSIFIGEDILSNNAFNSVSEKLIFNIYNNSYDERFTIAYPTDNYLFNLPSEIQFCNTPTFDKYLEYKIEGNVLELNVNNLIKNRNLLDKYNCIISYMGVRMDEDGFLMIPNEDYIIKAITYYVLSQLAFIDVSKYRDNKSMSYFKITKQIADREIALARSRYSIPDPDTWLKDLTNVLKIIPYSNNKINANITAFDRYRLPIDL